MLFMRSTPTYYIIINFQRTDVMLIPDEAGTVKQYTATGSGADFTSTIVTDEGYTFTIRNRYSNGCVVKVNSKSIAFGYNQTSMTATEYNANTEITLPFYAFVRII